MPSAAGDSRSNKAKRELASIDRRVEEATVQSIMRTGDGRRWMWNLLSQCAVFQPHDPRSHAEMAWNEGKRMVGLGLLQAVQRYCPQAYIQMTEEATKVSLAFNPDDEEDDVRSDLN